MDRMRTLSYIVTWILVFHAAVSGALQKEPFMGMQDEGQMTPLDPLVETNTTLELNCTLSEKYNGDYTADDIYFRLGNETFSSTDYVTVLDAKTARLRLPNVQRTMSGKNIFCYIPDPDVKHRIGQQVVTVADRPVLPRLTGCRVYNWKSMTCTWEPEKQDTGIPTDTQLYWTVFKRLHHCPHPYKASCTFKVLDEKGNSFRIDQIYYFMVQANNSVGIVQTNLSEINRGVETKYIVQPGNISTLGVTNSTSESLKINWTSPVDHTSLREVEFNVTWCAENKKTGGFEEQCQSKATKENQTELEDLAPYTRYKVKVKCIPIFKKSGAKSDCKKLSCYDQRGFWSHEKVEELITKEDVPAAAPETTESCFAFQDKRRVFLYWKRIPPYLSNGYITQYNINHTLLDEIPNGKTETTVVSGRSSKLEVTLRDDHIYKFVIDGQTQEGTNATLKPKPIVISTMKGTELKRPELFSTMTYENDRDHVVYNWTTVTGAVGYTVVWCKGFTDECHGELNWFEVDSEATNYTLILDEGQDYSNYIYGLSVKSQTTLPRLIRHRSQRSQSSPITLSSGIEWSACVYDSSKEVAPPSSFEFSDHQEASTLRVEWQHPDCKVSGFVLHYYIYYCLENDCEDPVVEYVGRDRTAYTLTSLEADKRYAVWMQSKTASGALSPQKTKTISKEVVFSGLRNGTIAGIVIGGALVLIIATVGLIYCCRNIKKKTETHKDTRADLPPQFPPQGGDEDDDDVQPMFADIGEEQFMPTSSGGSWMHHGDNLRNTIRESQLSNKREPALDLSDEEGNRVHTYMNGAALGAKDLGGVRYEKKQSADGSVSSMETLTTPLSVDLSRDSQDEMFRYARNRNISGGSNLNPVPESPVEDPENGYYNTSESSSIGSYNKIGFEHDPRAHDSTNSSENSSPLPAPLLCSVEGTNYHTLSSPETSPTRPTPREAGPALGGGREMGAAASKPNSPGSPQSPTEPSEYDVPSMISPYSKVNCVDFPMPDYDSSAGSFASTDTVIDTFKNKKAAPPLPMPQTDDYVSQGFMQTMASNSSLNLSDSSDIAPYSVVGEREATPDSNKDTYLDDEFESDESQPLCLNLDLPPVTSAAGYVQSPPPMYTSQSANSNDSDYVQAPPPPPPDRHSAALENGYVLAPPPVIPNGGSPADSNYVPHADFTGPNPSRSFHDTGYVQSADVSNLCNNNKTNKPCQNGPTSLNGHGKNSHPVQNGDQEYLPHSMANGVAFPPVTESNTDGSSKNCRNSAFPPSEENSKLSPPGSHGSSHYSGYISPDCLDSLGSSRSNGVPTDVQSNNAKPSQAERQVNDSYVTIDSITPSVAEAGAPVANGIEDSVSEGSSDQDGDYTNNVGMMTRPQNSGYVAHVTC